MRYIAIGIIALTLPIAALAASAGTDGYLREIGFTDAQLSTETPTEEREAFLEAEGVGRIEDPLGDVLDRFGITSGVRQPWGDISGAVLLKNDTTQTWDLAVTFGGTIPDAPAYGAQLFFYADADDDASNNAREGIRVGTDSEFNIQYDATNGWYADFRWYNPNADFWAVNKDTNATFEVAGDTIAVHVPFAEMPSSLAPHWRVAFAVADGARTQIDVVPGAGFPAPKGETYPMPPISRNGMLSWLGILVVALGIIYGAKRMVAKKRRA